MTFWTTSSKRPTETDTGERTLYPGDFGDIDELVDGCWQLIKDEIEQRGFGPVEIKIHMALAEALINAWKHGNQRRDDLPIVFRWSFNDLFTFEVTDAGNGFDSSQLPDPTRGEQLTAENGRGIFIIKTFAHSLQWREQGRRLRVSFRQPC
ncbi:MAG: ATP-binding protein [Desulfurivibrio sp.]|nr:ATP-binding protein [Desulfurivibrio sp.]